MVAVGHQEQEDRQDKQEEAINRELGLERRIENVHHGEAALHVDHLAGHLDGRKHHGHHETHHQAYQQLPCAKNRETHSIGR